MFYIEALEKKIIHEEGKSPEFYRKFKMIYNKIRDFFNMKFGKDERVQYSDIINFIVDNGLDDPVHREINKWAIGKRIKKIFYID